MATPLKYLPPVTFSVAPQGTLNQVAAASRAQDQQATLAAENAPLRVTFGRDRIGAQIAYALAYQGKLVLVCVWGLGEIDAIERIDIDDQPMPSSVVATHYTGTQAQTVNATLVAAFAAQVPAKVWTSALPGIAYSVLVVPPGIGSGFPQVAAVLRGLRLYDPRQDKRNNWVQWSEDTSGAGAGLGWNTDNVTLQSNQTTAPDGTATADRITDNNTAGGAHCWNQTLFQAQNGVPFCVAIHVKNINAVRGTLNCSTATVDYEVSFNWAAGVPTGFTASAGVSGAIATALGNGWYRVAFVVTAGADADVPSYIPIRYLPNGRSSASTASNYLWGVTLNEGAELVPYIKTGAVLGTQEAAVPATWAYSDNPALAIGRFLAGESGFGMGKTVNTASLMAAANACDEMVGSEKRRLIGITLDQVQSDKSWLEALRTYAGCIVTGLAEAEVKLVPDRPREAVRTIDFNAGQILDYGGIELRDITQAPTFVTVQWRDTTSTPWRDAFGPGAYVAGVVDGSVDYVPSQVALPGIRRRSQAAREEIERLNKLTLANLSCWIDVFDEQVALEVGDRVDVVLPDFGATAKPMVIAAITGEYGRFRLSLLEYEPAVYSDAVVAEPTWSDTTLPTPANPPASVGPLGLTEEGFTTADGANHTRVKATWTAPVYPFLATYRITVRQGASIIDTLTAATPEARTGTLQEGLAYQIDVQVTSTSGAVSAALSGAITVTGSSTPPGNPSAWVTAIEAGGTVFLAWLPVAGSTRYRLKVGSQGGTYAAATRIDDLDGTTYQAVGLPAGPQRIWLAALNRAGSLESAAPIYRDVVVTLDPALLVTNKTFAAPALSAMSYFKADRTLAGAWITDFGDGFGFGHADTNDATGTFADLAGTPFAHPHTAGTSAWESESWDLASSIAGSWTTDVAVTNLSGTATIKIRLSPDNSAWTDYTYTGAPIAATGRYARVRVETAGTMQIAEPVSAAVTVAARRDPNAGTVTTSASAAVTVTLANKYIQAKTIALTPKGTTAKTVTYDNVVLGAGTNSFDVYAFNAAGAQIAADVSWAFEGI